MLLKPENIEAALSDMMAIMKVEYTPERLHQLERDCDDIHDFTATMMMLQLGLDPLDFTRGGDVDRYFEWRNANPFKDTAS